MFHCRIRYGGNHLIFWLVDGKSYVSEANRNRSISVETRNNRQSTLTIVAHPWNDNVQVQCIFHSILTTNVSCSNETVTCSDKAVLRIQGM